MSNDRQPQLSASWWQRLKQQERDYGRFSTAISLVSSLLSFLGGTLLFDAKNSPVGVSATVAATGWISCLIIWMVSFYVYVKCGPPGRLSRGKNTWLLVLTLMVAATLLKCLPPKVALPGIAGVILLSTMAVHALLTLGSDSTSPNNRSQPSGQTQQDVMARSRDIEEGVL